MRLPVLLITITVFLSFVFSDMALAYTKDEAFLESLKNYRPSAIIETDYIKSQLISETTLDHRKIYIPYMGDCAYGVAACIRSFGRPAEVMPMANQNTLSLGRHFTNGKECLPCAITAGDMLKVIKDKNDELDKVAFFMPGGTGPCRFGMYNCMHKLILKYIGAQNTPVIAPNQSDGFYGQLAKNIKGSTKLAFTRDIWTAAVGIDLLNKLLLRLRPFAKQPQRARQIYNRALKDWIKLVENRAGLKKLIHFMKSVAEKFGSIKP